MSSKLINHRVKPTQTDVNTKVLNPIYVKPAASPSNHSKHLTPTRSGGGGETVIPSVLIPQEERHHFEVVKHLYLNWSRSYVR